LCLGFLMRSDWRWDKVTTLHKTYRALGETGIELFLFLISIKNGFWSC
jgi:hypothetical protein